MAGSMTLRAAWRVLRRLFEAAFLPESDHRRSIACSRCMRWPGARARSFTKIAAFLRCQASWGMVLEPILTRKPPSNQTLIDLRFSPLATSDLLRRSDPEGPIPLLPHLRFALAVLHPQNVLCWGRLTVRLTSLVRAPIHSHRLPPDLRQGLWAEELVASLLGLGTPKVLCASR